MSKISKLRTLIQSGILLAGWSGVADATAEQAALLDLNEDGIDLLANEMERTVLRDINKVPLPDYEDEIDYGVKLSVEDATYSMKFGDLNLELRNGYLNVQVGIRNVRLDAERLKFKKRVLGGTLRSTCRDTTIKMGYEDDIPLEARMAVGMRSGKVKVELSKISFSIDENNYQVSGPRTCTGDVGVGRLIRSLVKSILERSRSRIEDAVARKARDLGTDLEKQLDSQTRLEMAFRVDLPPLPAMPIAIRTWPQSINISPARLRLELGASAQRPDLGKSKASCVARPAVLGDLGFNPQLLNEVLAAVVGDGIEPIELNVDSVPGIDEILDTDRASAIWPDLFEAPLTGDKLKLAFGLEEAPTFRLNAEDQTLDLLIPALPLRFSAPLQERWVPYFTINLRLQAALQLTEVDGVLILRFAAPPVVSADGYWEDGYTPSTDWYEQDLAESILTSVFDYLYASGPLWEGQATLPEIGGRQLRLSAPRIRAPYIVLSLGGNAFVDTASRDK